MINRYSRKELTKIWEEKNKYQIWLDIEIAAAQGMEKFKYIPKGVAAKVKKVVISPKERIKKIRLTHFPLQGLNGRICQISPSSFSIAALVTMVKAIASSTLLAM